MRKKYSIFRSKNGESKLKTAYDTCLLLWDVPYESLFVDTSYGKTHVLVSGPVKGEPLLLLHGMTFSSTMWYSNISVLAQKYRTFCIDTPGDYGRSEVTVPLKSRADCVDWLTEVMDGLNLDKANLIGHSMGGWLSLNFAISSPERVKRLILLAPVVSILRLPFKFMFKVYPVMLRPSRSKILKLWSWFLAEGSELNQNVQEQIVQAWLNCKPQLRVVPNVFSEKELSSLQPKTLFLVGDEEVIYDANKAITRVKAVFPRVEAVIIPKSSHCLVVEQSEAVNSRISHFLAQ